MSMTPAFLSLRLDEITADSGALKINMTNLIVDWNLFHEKNHERARTDFRPVHNLIELAACVAEEVGELSEALAYNGPSEPINDAVADITTYLSLVSGVKCDFEWLIQKSQIDPRLGRFVRITSAQAFIELVKEMGKMVSAALGVTGKKERKKHLTLENLEQAVTAMLLWLQVIATNNGCQNFGELVVDVFNMVSKRAGSSIFYESVDSE